MKLAQYWNDIGYWEGVMRKKNIERTREKYK